MLYIHQYVSEEEEGSLVVHQVLQLILVLSTLLILLGMTIQFLRQRPNYRGTNQITDVGQSIG